jgi:hypothetical protein
MMLKASLTARNHLKAFLFGTAAWAVFFVGGLPDYYQQYSTGSMIAFDLLVLLPLWAAAVLLLRWLEGDSQYAKAVVLAFYITVPLFAYDLLYCGVYLGHGLGFVARYWYLSVYYVVPWLILPPTGVWLDRRAQVRKG